MIKKGLLNPENDLLSHTQNMFIMPLMKSPTEWFQCHLGRLGSYKGGTM